MKNIFHLPLILSTILLSIGHAFANTEFPNCTTDITVDFPDDWREGDVIRGLDGSAWKRATIVSPGKYLELKEAEPAVISGVAAPYRPVQVVLYSPKFDEDGVLLRKPTQANCLETEGSDGNGLFSLPLNARMIWAGIGQQMAVDAYYKMDVSWSAIQAEKNKRSMQTFFIGSTMPPKIYTIQGEELPGEEYCQVLCQESGTLRALSLSEDELTPRLLGNNFEPINGEVVTVGRLPGPHTYYVDVDDEPPSESQWNILQRILHKSLGMEITKRVLLANENTNGISPGLAEMNADQLRAAAQANGSYSPRTEELAVNIKVILTAHNYVPTEDVFDVRQQAAEKIEYLVGKQEGETFFKASLVREVLVPDVSTDATWAEDFVQMMNFWTDKVIQNDCLLADDNEMWKNFTESSADMGGGVCSFMFINGQTPRLLLHTKEDIRLIPNFIDTKIVYSETPFDFSEGWSLPSGKKDPLYYLYHFSQPFTGSFTPNSCITTEDLPEYLDMIEYSFGLWDDERQVLQTELFEHAKNLRETFAIRLANPKDIRARFRWKGNGEHLDILPLFFQTKEKSCAPHIQQLSASASSRIRDGFEVGILK